ERALEEHLPGLRNDVPVIGVARLRLRDRVDEAVPELAERPAHDTRPEQRAEERRPERPEGTQLERPHAARRRGVDRHARRAQPTIEQDLREQPAERVPDEDRRLGIVEGAHQLLVVIDDLADAEALERRWVSPNRLDRAVLARPRGRDAAIAAGLEPGEHPFPAGRRHPRAVDEHDRAGHGRIVDQAGAPSAASVSWATTSAVLLRSVPERGIVAVGPKPTIRLDAASRRTAMTAVQTEMPPRSGIATDRLSEASIASRSKAMYMPSQRDPTTPAQVSSAASPAGPASMPAPKWAIGEAASIRDSSWSNTCPPRSAASSSLTEGPSQALTRLGSPRPQSIAKGMPHTLPEGVVVGMLKSPWASNQAIARRASGFQRLRPAIAALCEVQSPPRSSRRVELLTAAPPAT